jgi:hypothetical protein
VLIYYSEYDLHDCQQVAVLMGEAAFDLFFGNFLAGSLSSRKSVPLETLLLIIRELPII